MPPNNWESPENLYSDARLAMVVTLAEACAMWNISPSGLRMKIWKGKVSARRSFTGGGWLILVASMMEEYGMPTDHYLAMLYTGDNGMPSN